MFQSLLDAWAIKQFFPVMPIHRLKEKPTQQAILVDITCDSDGTLQQFPLQTGLSNTLPLHEERAKETYLIGIFLTGAYQEILGDLHNLFGDTHAVHIRMDGDHSELEQVVEGESVSEVLDYVQFHETVLVDRMRRQVQDDRHQGRLTSSEANTFLRFFQEGLKGIPISKKMHPSYKNGIEYLRDGAVLWKNLNLFFQVGFLDTSILLILSFSFNSITIESCQPGCGWANFSHRKTS